VKWTFVCRQTVCMRVKCEREQTDDGKERETNSSKRSLDLPFMHGQSPPTCSNYQPSREDELNPFSPLTCNFVFDETTPEVQAYAAGSDWSGVDFPLLRDTRNSNHKCRDGLVLVGAWGIIGGEGGRHFFRSSSKVFQEG
jgi:hypothetical protein